LNTTFSKALHLLAHPLSIFAIALLVMNDFVLKPYSPSIWTGKLSDLAVLFFFPFLLAVCLAWILPETLKWKKVVVTAISFGLPLLGFALLKLDAQTNRWLIENIRSISGFSVRAVPDPGDCFALISLAAAGWLWKRTPQQKIRRADLRRGLLILPLTMVFSLADAAAPDYGINQICAQDQALIAKGYYSSFKSTDGGLSWSDYESPSAEISSVCNPESDFFLEDPLHGLKYHVIKGQSIEVSSDDGQTWNPISLPAPMNEAEETYLRKTSTSNLFISPDPLDAAIDPASGNLILAMGHEGVLVQSPGKSLNWASVGKYQHSGLENAGFSGYAFLLTLEIILIAAASFFWLDSNAFSGRKSLWQTVLFAMGCACFALAYFCNSPDIATSTYMGIVSWGGVFLAALWTLGLILFHAVREKGNFLPTILKRLPFVPLVFIACLLPYGLWSLDILHQYWMAAVSSAVILTLAILIGKIIPNQPNREP
jgi:hypothetical protein